MITFRQHIDELAHPSMQAHNECHLFIPVLQQYDAHVWDWAEHKSWQYDTDEHYESMSRLQYNWID